MTRREVMQSIPLFFPIRLVSNRPDIVTIANDFAEAYREWVVLKQQELAEPGSVNIAAVRQWEVVRRRWKELDGVVRNS